jgi:hypothetical protein
MLGLAVSISMLALGVEPAPDSPVEAGRAEPAVIADPAATEPAALETPAAAELGALPTTTVPPPAGEPTQVIDRNLRLFDLTTDVPELIARDAPMARWPRFGGVADRLIWRAAGSAESGDVLATLDGHRVGPALSGRGVNPLELHLVPVMALSSYRLRPGVSLGAYAGRIDLASRHTDGVDLGVWLGDHRQQRFGVAGGASRGDTETFVAVESRGARDRQARAEDDLLTAFARAGTKLEQNVAVELSLRAYDNDWDEAGVLRDDVLEPAALTDGGEQRGLGAGLAVTWDPSPAIALSAHLSHLEDRWQRFTTDDEQREAVDRNRTSRASADLRLAPPCLHDTVFTFGMISTWDRGVVRRFNTAARQRQGARLDQEFELVEMGANAGVEIEVVDSLVVSAAAELWQPTLRLDDPRQSTDPISSTETLPGATVGLTLEADLLTIELRAGHSNRLNSSVLAGAELTVPHDGAELALLGTLSAAEGLSIAWRASGYYDRYGSSSLGMDFVSDSFMAAGGELGLDLVHADTGVVLAARGGMLRTFAYDRGSEPFITVPIAGDDQLVGLPESTWHIGFLRPRERGVVFELWFDGQGEYAVSSGGDTIAVPSTTEASARVGYRSEAFALWLGAKNLLEDDDPFEQLDATTAIPRPERTAYVLFELR